MTDLETQPDWATEFDHTKEDYAQRAPEIWDELRERCPVAHTEAFGGTWLPVRHEDVSAVAHDTENFSSEGVVVSPFKPEGLAPMGYAPPITSDPPFHKEARRLLLPAFAPRPINGLEDDIRASCRQLLDDLLADGREVVDAAAEYAQEIPVRAIATMLGLPPEDGDRFRVFIHRILEKPGEYSDELAPEDTFIHYIEQELEARREQPPKDDLIGFLMQAEMDGEPLGAEHVFGTIALLVIAGIDTTWSAIGSSLWHLAQNREDRIRWCEDEAVRPFAVEEFLRFYAPVTMARIAARDTEIGGCPVKARDWVLLPFPAANRDPEAFEDADRFVIDRQRNRHSAFGLGIHRCLGSNLARLELTIALEEWMDRIPHFELADTDPDSVRWSTGQVRGPRELPVRILETAPATDDPAEEA